MTFETSILFAGGVAGLLIFGLGFWVGTLAARWSAANLGFLVFNGCVYRVVHKHLWEPPL